MENSQARPTWLGVTGHRPNKLPAASLRRIGAQCGEIIDALAAMVGRVGIVSALAEGADRLVAEMGLARGFELQCVLPFAAHEYERDFATAQSKLEFHALLGRGTRVATLDSDPSNRPAGYERAGRVMLDLSDVLLAIWDGHAAAGRGGSAQMVNEASARGMPVIWIYNEETRPAVLRLADEGDAPVIASMKRLGQHLARAPVTARFRPQALS